MDERQAGQLQEDENLEAVALVVGDTEQLGVGVEGQHRASGAGLAIADTMLLTAAQIYRRSRVPAG
jgi:hypothetical protein